MKSWMNQSPIDSRCHQLILMMALLILSTTWKDIRLSCGSRGCLTLCPILSFLWLWRKPYGWVLKPAAWIYLFLPIVGPSDGSPLWKPSITFQEQWQPLLPQARKGRHTSKLHGMLQHSHAGSQGSQQVYHNVCPKVRTQKWLPKFLLRQEFSRKLCWAPWACSKVHLDRRRDVSPLEGGRKERK